MLGIQGISLRDPVPDRIVSYIECVISQVSKSNPHPSDEDLSLGTPRPGAPGVYIPGPQVRGTWGTQNWYKNMWPKT